MVATASGHTIGSIAAGVDAKIRKGIVAEVVRRIDDLPAEKSSAVGAWLAESNLKGGFRTWREAPQHVVVAAAQSTYGKTSPFWGLFVDAWVDLHAPLRERLGETIERLGLSRICPCRHKDAIVQWNPEKLSEAVKAVFSAAPELAPEPEIRLALQVLSSGTTGGEYACAPGVHGEAGADEEGSGAVDGADPDDDGPPPLTAEEIRAEILHLAGRLKAMAPEVRACAEAMAGARPPAPGLADRLHVLEADWNDVCDSLTGLGAPLSDPPAADTTELVGVLDRFESEQRKRDEQAPVLDAALRLRASKPRPDLDALQRQVREVLARTGPPPSVSWRQAVSALVSLCDPNVPDDQVDAFRAPVEVEFGKSLAVAAVRRFIELSPGLAMVPPEAGSLTAEATSAPAVDSPPVLDGPAPGPPDSAPADEAKYLVPVAREPVVASPATDEPAPEEAQELEEAQEEQPPRATCSTDLARKALETEEALRPGAAVDVVWALASEGEYSTAFGLAHALQDQGAFSTNALSSAMLRGLVFSARVSAQEDAAASEVLDALMEMEVPGADDAGAQPRSIVCAAVTLRPALLSRSSGAMGVLQQLDLDATGSLSAIRELVVRSQSLGMDIGPAVLQGPQQAGTARVQADALSREYADWVEAAPKQRLRFAGATDTWHRLLVDGSVLAELAGAVLSNDPRRREWVERECERLSDAKQIERLIRTAEKEVRGRKATTNPVDGSAFHDLSGKVDEALSFPRRWLELVSLGQDTRRDAAMLKFDHWRGELLRAIQTGVSRLRKDPHHGLEDTAARHVLRRALEDLEELLSPGKVAPPALNRDQALLASLLRIPRVELDDDWRTRQAAGDVVTRILQALAGGLPSWEDALEVHRQAENFLAVYRILELADAGAIPLADREGRRAAADTTVVALRDELFRMREQRMNELEQAVGLDLFKEADRLDLVAEIEQLTAPSTLVFGAARAGLARVEGIIRARYQAKAQDMARRVEAERIREKDPEAHRRIQEALDRRDFPTATEHIDALSRGEPLRPQASADVFTQTFFPAFVQMCSRPGFSITAVPDAITRGISVDAVDMSSVPAPRREGAAALVSAWLRIKRKSDILANVVAVLEGLGFETPRVTSPLPAKADGVLIVEVQTQEVCDRNVCVIPQFGSLAHGRYRIACVWGHVSEEELLARLPQGHGSPIIVLFLDVMKEPKRRELARLCRQNRRQLLVVDESLLVLLAMQPGARLPVLFQCALPFTVASPYVTSAGLVPREMFFGRQAEMQRIFDRLGTNLVYGGRQLGKTALLREVERAHHDPSHGVIVAWADLKQAGIGWDRAPRSLWEVIGGILEQHGVVKKGTLGFKTIRERVMEWLRVDEARRIVLLLDEADRFLAADREGNDGESRKGESFGTLLELKGLLDESEKRFKFVLAGLHDVQRTSRDPNTPLAHLGSPLCIGPLLGDGEALEARALIEAPLVTLGYRFEHPDLPTRILSHTNYYPSLIQLFCSHLLDHVANPSKARFSPKSTPPFVIQAEHVDEAYRSQKLRSAIRDRFKWTLDLDPRYKLIALLIASDSAEPPEAPEKRFTAREIQEGALTYWSQGFDDQSPEAFRTILDEMIGLGLLRKTPDGTYMLRSMNVLNVLGTKKEITEELDATASLEPPKPHEYPHLRRAWKVEKGEDALWRSPLTRTQEARVLQRENGACVIFGAAIAEAGVLGEFLQATGARYAVTLQDFPNRGKLEYAIGKALDRRDPYAVIVVSAATPWTEPWIEDAQKLLQKRSTDDATVRVIFLGSPSDALRWCKVDPAVQQRLASLEVETICLAPWTDGAFRAWFEDCQIGPANDAQGRGNVRKVTGGWAALVHRFGLSCRERGKTWHDQLASLDAALTSDEVTVLFEIPPGLLPRVKALCELQGKSPLVEVAPLLDDPALTLEVLEEAFAWAKFIGYATSSADGWSMDPVLCRALRGRT